MLVEACHTTILIIISAAHSKKVKGVLQVENSRGPVAAPRGTPSALGNPEASKRRTRVSFWSLEHTCFC